MEAWGRSIVKLHKTSSFEKVKSTFSDLDTVTKKYLLEQFGNSQYQTDNTHAYITASTKMCVMTLHNIEINTLECKAHSVEYAILVKVIRRCYSLCKLYNITSTIRIWFVPTKTHRRFPQPGKELTSYNINGGFTYTYGHTGTPSMIEIFIIRLEEFPKVILHELLHHSKFHSDNLSAIQLYTLFNIDKTNCNTKCHTRLEPNEAIVELWAELHQMAFVSYETGVPFQELLLREQKYAMQKSQDLLIHQASLNHGVWREETHAFSYIFIRSILLVNIESFIKLQIPYTENDIVEFIKRYYTSFKHMIAKPKERKTSKLRMTSIIGDF